MPSPPAQRGHVLQNGWIDRPHQEAAIGDLPLENGQTLQDCRIGYVVHRADSGPAPRRGDKVVLVLCAIGTSHHRLDSMIGEGRAFDPARYTVIAVDALGNGLSSSPSNSATQPGMAFPRFSIRDMVESQSRLLRSLGVDRLHAVAGASMGGMQALQWAVSLPQPVERVIAMTPMAKTHPWSVVINETARRALLRALDSGRPWDAWVPLMQLVSGRTPESIGAQFASGDEAIAWIRRRCDERHAEGPEPLDWIYQSWAYDQHDLGQTPGFGGDTEAALRAISASCLVAAAPLDLYNPSDAARTVAAAIPRARWLKLPSHRGHQAASAADAEAAALLNRHAGALLAA
ncbi:alpha/beta fold hydrolase [Xylophilus sp.]|uniref:alpha/beta fold hydrolase n=1 Tax=Xylophilus sp. TaxID=2653893 RepID=UPI0013B93EF5|nr:alpha/beta fold hydrolase [Xylophilus sp.]KAF1050188.1 MAG: Homoserine O-acetyltransferase [Xylophilus sp.]